MRARRTGALVRGGIAVLGTAAAVAALDAARRSAGTSGGKAANLPALAGPGLAGSASSAPVSSERALSGPVVRLPTHHDVSPPMRDVPARPERTRPLPRLEHEPTEPRGLDAPTLDPVVQRRDAPSAMPAPSLTVEGISNADNEALRGPGQLYIPPDPAGDVGPNDYVQMANLAWSVYTKAGATRAGFPKATSSLWSGFSNTTCRDFSIGDVIAMYDQAADRWFLTEFAFPFVGGVPSDPFTQCIAVSTTGDPTGTYNRYAYVFPPGKLNDYGKFGVWPDAYYASYNVFNEPAGTFSNTTVAAYDRAAMIAGAPSPAQITFDVMPGNLVPSDLDGPSQPPAGAPNVFVRRVDSPTSGGDLLRLWEFDVDFAVPASSTFTGPTDVSVADFDGIFTADIPQPPVIGETVPGLDPHGPRVMQRVAYRRFATHEAIVLNHVADVDTNHAGVRWYEVRDPAGTPLVFQQGTYAPDADNRWVGSAAMDCNGNIAIGYSVSSATTFPSIRYAGRLATDLPLGVLTQGEATLVAGAGSQHEGFYTPPTSRWGDYTTMQVDPSDDATFWYVNEYYPVSSDSDWHTKVGTFSFGGGCPATATGVSRLGARFVRSGAAVTWRTSSETSIAGFHLWRTSGRESSWRRVNRTLIPARRAGRPQGAEYRIVDRSARRGRFSGYRLQVVDLGGRRSWYGVGTSATP